MQWNLELIINKYLDESTKIYKDLFSLDLDEADQRLRELRNSGQNFCCPVCYDETADYVDMECGHALCRICYKGYLDAQMKDGPEVVLCRCPISPCKLIVSDENFKILLDPQDYKRYQEYYKKSFISNNKTTKYCPAPNCNDAVIYPSMKQADIICKCGNDFCFKCMKPAHRPIPCDVLAEWQAKINQGMDDSEIWLKLNTKPCPKCKVSIQKNQGCMHMTCSQCRYEFCWLCMGDYKNHSS